MRLYPNLHPFIAKKIGIRMMYAPPFRPAHHAFRPIRPLVVLIVALTHSEFCRTLYARFANCWMRRFPHA